MTSRQLVDTFILITLSLRFVFVMKLRILLCKRGSFAVNVKVAPFDTYCFSCKVWGVVGKCSQINRCYHFKLWVTVALVRWFLVQHPLCDRFHPVTARNLQQPPANHLGNILVSPSNLSLPSCCQAVSKHGHNH